MKKRVKIDVQMVREYLNVTFPKIYLGTFWYNYHVHVINHVAMATSF